MKKFLEELKTVRSSPTARFVRKVANSSPFGTISSVASYLRSAGAKVLGSGMRASVLESPRKDSVIKIYHQDTGYDSFLDHVKTDKDNPHFPKIMQRGKIPLDKTGESHLRVVRMENLSELHPDHPIRDAMPIVGTPQKILGQLNSGQHNRLKEKYPRIHQAIYDLAKKHENDDNPPIIDLHDKNIMQRKDGTPVITDPMVSWSDRDNPPEVKKKNRIKEPMSTDQLKGMIQPKVKLSSSDMKLLDQLTEEAPTNNVGSGNIAGVGVGPKGEPGRNPSLMPMVRRSKDFAGKAVFKVPPKLYDEARLEKRKYQRWTKYLDEEAYDKLAPIREYANANPSHPIIIENEKTGAMCYIKYGSRK
jgi:hypothetical protein